MKTKTRVKTATEQKTKTKATAIRDDEESDRGNGLASFPFRFFFSLASVEFQQAPGSKSARTDRNGRPVEAKEQKKRKDGQSRGSRSRMRIEDQDPDKTLFVAQRCSLYIYIGLSIYTTRLSPRSAIILPLLRHRPPDGLALA